MGSCCSSPSVLVLVTVDPEALTAVNSSRLYKSQPVQFRPKRGSLSELIKVDDTAPTASEDHTQLCRLIQHLEILCFSSNLKTKKFHFTKEDKICIPLFFQHVYNMCTLDSRSPHITQSRFGQCVWPVELKL